MNILCLVYNFLPDVDEYEGNKWDNGEEHQVQDAGNLMTVGRNVRVFFQVSAIHQVTGGSEEVDLSEIIRVDHGVDQS